MMSLLKYLVDFAERWLGTLPQLIVVFTGILLCILAVGALWDRRIGKTGFILGVCTGLSLSFHLVIVRAFSNVPIEITLRIFVILTAFAVLTLTIQAVKRNLLSYKHGVIWVGSALILFLIGIFPEFLVAIHNNFGLSYMVLIGGACLVFIALLCFQLSIVFNGRNNHFREIPWGSEHIIVEKSSIFYDDTHCRSIRGTHFGAPLVILIAVFAVIVVGVSTPEPMVGDEVTHYYMMKTQSLNLSQPNFFAEIPLANGEIETRRYPHSFLWHYGAAVLHRLTGGSFWVIQIYQGVFFLQLLIIGYLLAKSRGGVETRSALLYVLTLASLPLSIIFSVAFYQDVPMTAQIITAFFFLKRARWLVATFFLCLAIGLKVTAILFLPAFFILLLFWGLKRSGWKSGFLSVCCSAIIVFCCLWVLGKSINIYAESTFYPMTQLESIVNKVKWSVKKYVTPSISANKADRSVNQEFRKTQQNSKARYVENAPLVIANHPGDLRIKENFLVYGGILMWLLLFLGVCGRARAFYKSNSEKSEEDSGWWVYVVGLSYLVIAGYFLKTSPDARFFLPGLVFLFLPVAEGVVKLPKPKLVVSLVATLAIFQAGYVLAKAHRLRDVPPGIHDAIAYLEANPPDPSWIFMYPEGNYRLFPVSHNWYFNNRLKEFWRGDNEFRIDILHEFEIGAIIIKKALVAKADENYTNLGIYPVKFVEEISNDTRFQMVLSNNDVSIYLVPQVH